MSALIAIHMSMGLLASTLPATTLTAADVIRSGDIISMSNTENEDGFSANDEMLMGREVRRTIYAGQPVMESNTRSPRLVTRNQIVTVKYLKENLEITVTGRAMAEGGEGQNVSVMNLKSRQLIQGIVMKDGWILAQ